VTRESVKISVLIVSAAALVVGLRIVPLFSLIVQDWTDRSIRQQIASQIAAQNGTMAGEMDPQRLAAEVDGMIATHRAAIEPVARELESKYRGTITFEGQEGRLLCFRVQVDVGELAAQLVDTVRVWPAPAGPDAALPVIAGWGAVAARSKVPA
jgi:hypothetical protein